MVGPWEQLGLALGRGAQLAPKKRVIAPKKKPKRRRKSKSAPVRKADAPLLARLSLEELNDPIDDLFFDDPMPF